MSPVRRTAKLGRLARGDFPRHRRAHLAAERSWPGVGARSGGSARDRSARSARALASFASYADSLLSHTEIVSSGPERPSDLGLCRNLMKVTQMKTRETTTPVRAF